VILEATRATGEVVSFEVRLRIDTSTEADYYRHGGVLNFVLRQLALDAAL
jgi:aconitate hydratase